MHNIKILLAEKHCQKCEEAFQEFATSTYNCVVKYCSDTLKRTSNIIDINSRYFAQLRNVDNVIVIGHSFGKVDKPYFEEVFDSVRKDAFWTVYYYNEAEKNKFEQRLLSLGVKEEKMSVLDLELLRINGEQK